jgi:hypothetical protein
LLGSLLVVEDILVHEAVHNWVLAEASSILFIQLMNKRRNEREFLLFAKGDSSRKVAEPPYW